VSLSHLLFTFLYAVIILSDIGRGAELKWSSHFCAGSILT